MIKYEDILAESVVDGEGIRAAAFLKGCPRHCPGCHNPNLLTQEGAKEVDPDKFAAMILEKITPIHHGVTFSGGDPLLQHEDLFTVISQIKKVSPALSIWVYTGYLFEEIKDLPVVKLVDVIVDGPFILDQKDLSLPFRGSANQRIIDVQASLKQQRIILYKK